MPLTVPDYIIVTTPPASRWRTFPRQIDYNFLAANISTLTDDAILVVTWTAIGAYVLKMLQEIGQKIFGCSAFDRKIFYVPAPRGETSRAFFIWPAYSQGILSA